ncbi:leucyl/phenylalanyl-tRNA--protein transferase [Dermacoccaceae bacterium W4C1]
MIEPPESVWDLASAVPSPDEDLVAVGGDLEPGTILQAYRAGLFPMGLGRHGRSPIGWWSPQSRGVLLPGDLHVSRSLRRTRRSMTVTFDTAFDEVVAGCADPSRSGRWITTDIATAYRRLFDLGWAHSVEVWQGHGPQRELVGGLYGLGLGGLFAGESMFHRATDASKVALWALVEVCFADGDPRRLIDVQWQTTHLSTMGVREVSRSRYAQRLAAALSLDPPTDLVTTAG